MQIYEKINEILKSKNLSKKDFANEFLKLNPTLKSTGEVPSMPTIYNYLNGTREIKVELIPYIAETLNICEQELFLEDQNMDEFLINFIKTYEFKGQNKEAKFIYILKLLNYASQPLLDKIIKSLEENRDKTLSIMCQI